MTFETLDLTLFPYHQKSEMARAYLKVDEGLVEAFVGCQEDNTVRWVKARIEEEEVVLAGTGKADGTAEEDFRSLADEVSIDEPVFFLFSTGDRRWMVVAWVPDAAAPRLKMLYSSSREDLKTGLGSGYFLERDYCANAVGDLRTYPCAEEKTDAPLTESEVLLAEEKLLEKETTKTRMRSLPFALSSNLQRLLGSSEEQSIVQITLDKEVLDGTEGEELDEASPKFVLVDKKKLVYYCPDSASLKEKMTYSTAKTTLLELLGHMGIKIIQSSEATSDLRQAVFDAQQQQQEETRRITHQPNTKPQAPGRRRPTTAGKKNLLKKWSAPPAPP